MNCKNKILLLYHITIFLLQQKQHKSQFEQVVYNNHKGLIHHMNDIRWTQGGCERTSLRSLLVVFAPSTGVSNVCKAKNVLLLVQNEECVHEKSSFDWGPPLST